MKSYIQFNLFEKKSKTDVYSVDSISRGERLGLIAWYGPWRQYVFCPQPSTFWSHDCLAKVEEFLIKLNGEYKQKI